MFSEFNISVIVPLHYICRTVVLISRTFSLKADDRKSVKTAKLWPKKTIKLLQETPFTQALYALAEILIIAAVKHEYTNIFIYSKTLTSKCKTVFEYCSTISTERSHGKKS